MEENENYQVVVATKIEARLLSQKSNTECTLRTDEYEETLKTLDSSIKKSTDFLKKLKSLSETQKDNLLKDFNALNLSKYLQEICNTLFNSKFKSSDIPCFLELCYAAHRRYKDFSVFLYESVQKTLNTILNFDKPISNFSKTRNELKLCSELIASHIFVKEDPKTKGFNLILKFFKQIVIKDKIFLFINLVTAFCKNYSEEYMDHYMIPISPHYKSFTEGEMTTLRTLLIDTYFKGLVLTKLNAMLNEVKKLNRINRNLFRTKGEVHPERLKTFNELYESFNKFLTDAKGLASALYMSDMIPVYKHIPYDSMLEDDEDEMVKKLDEQGTDDADNTKNDWSNAGDEFDDADTQAFYKDLPDLTALIPAIVYRSSVKSNMDSPSAKANVNTSDMKVSDEKLGAVKNRSPKTNMQAKDEIDYDEFLKLSSVTAVETVGGTETSEQPEPKEADPISKTQGSVVNETSIKVTSENSVPVKTSNMDDDSDLSSFSLDVDSDLELLIDQEFMVGFKGEFGEKNAKTKKKQSSKREKSQVGATNILMKHKMDEFLNNLPLKTNRDLIDDAARLFITELNNKINRNRLTTQLLSVPRNRTDLLPFYGRLIAILRPCLPEWAQEICKKLYSSFRFQLRKKDQINIEIKLKIVKFLAELTKFGIYSPLDMCYCIFLLNNDFKYHSIEMMCAILESCGRYLIRAPESRQRAKFLLESLRRKEQAMPLIDERYKTLIENAYFYCLPPQSAFSDTATQPSYTVSEFVKEKSLDPIQRYIRKLLYTNLISQTMSQDKIIILLRKLPWDIWVDNETSNDSITTPEMSLSNDTNVIIQNEEMTNKQLLTDTSHTNNLPVSENENETVESVFTLTPLEEYFIATVLQLKKFRYDRIRYLAHVVSSVSLYRGDTIGIALIDDLLEALKNGLSYMHYNSYTNTDIGMDGVNSKSNFSPSPKPSAILNPTGLTQQDLLLNVTFLSELYNYRLADSELIFKVLYCLIMHDEVQPPTDLFGLTLPLKILETCGAYFERGTLKKRLDCFLLYLQRNYIFKRNWPGWSINDADASHENPDLPNIPNINQELSSNAFPVDFTNYLTEVYEKLRPKATMYTDLASINEAIQKWESENDVVKHSQPSQHISLLAHANGKILGENGINEEQMLRPENYMDEYPPIEQQYQINVSYDNGPTPAYDKNLAMNQDGVLMDINTLSQLELESRLQTEKMKEDEEFIKSFDSMISESLQQTTHDMVKLTMLDQLNPSLVKKRRKEQLSGRHSKHQNMPPKSLLSDEQPPNVNYYANRFEKNSQKDDELLSANSEIDLSSLTNDEDYGAYGDESNTTTTKPRMMNFVLVSRKGNKPQFRDVKIPFDENMASRIKDKEEAEKREKEQLKKLTLNINQLQEEEERKNQIMEFQNKSSFPVNLKDKPQPHKHPINKSDKYAGHRNTTNHKGDKF